MSISNYRRCVALGVTGRNAENCFVAGIDKLLPGQRVDPDFYMHYVRELARISEVPRPKRNPHFLQLYAELEAQVGGEPFYYARVRSAEELHATVEDAHDNEYEVVLDVAVERDLVHSLGLHVYDRRRGEYMLTSTHTPMHLRGVVSLEYIFPYMAQLPDPPRIWYPFNDANVTLIPHI